MIDVFSFLLLLNFDQDGASALHIAVANDLVSVVSSLISRGAAINQSNTRDMNTALHVACLHVHLDMVNLLLEAGVDANRTNQVGE